MDSKRSSRYDGNAALMVEAYSMTLMYAYSRFRALLFMCSQCSFQVRSCDSITPNSLYLGTLSMTQKRVKVYVTFIIIGI